MCHYPKSISLSIVSVKVVFLIMIPATEKHLTPVLAFMKLETSVYFISRTTLFTSLVKLTKPHYLDYVSVYIV